MTSLIALWNNRYLTDNPTSYVITTENLHIDLKGLLTKDDRQYYGVEIQGNIDEFPQVWK